MCIFKFFKKQLSKKVLVKKEYHGDMVSYTFPTDSGDVTIRAFGYESSPGQKYAVYERLGEWLPIRTSEDVFVKDVMFWTYIGGMIASGCISLPVALGAGVRGGKISTMEKVGIIAPLAIMGTAGLGYITFEIATLVRRSKYEKYYQKWNDYRIVPFVNPVNGGVGGLLSLNF